MTADKIKKTPQERNENNTTLVIPAFLIITAILVLILI
jgi:hypothetical protein